MSSLLGSFGVSAPKKRRVFFSFHYQKDIWRANQVRNSWRFQHENAREAEGFFDGSLWESSRLTSDASLKNLIRSGMENTSVTCVLSGAMTAGRRWVRYEIAQSLVRGNGLLNVQIHNMLNQSRQACFEGTNPLSVMGVYKSGHSIFIAEKSNGVWQQYEDYSLGVTLPYGWAIPTTNAVIQLSSYTKSYCYVREGGSYNFGSWISYAATSVGR